MDKSLCSSFSSLSELLLSTFILFSFSEVVGLDLCIQSGGDVYSGAFLYSSHGTHRFPHGAGRSRANHQRAGEESVLVPKVHTQTTLFLLFITGLYVNIALANIHT